MKILLEIKDGKALHLMEAVEELILISQGKLKGIPAKKLLDRL